MPRIANTDKSLLALIRDLPEQAKAFVKEEVQLAKTEIAEKISALTRNAAGAAAGAGVAYAGLVLLLVGLGFLAAYGLEKWGLEAFMAAFAGLSAVGLLSALVGGLLIFKGIKKISAESLAPEKTIETLKAPVELPPGPGPEPLAERSRTRDRSSDELQESALASKNQVGGTAAEIGQRLKPAYVASQVKQHVRTHPVPWVLASVGTGILSGVLIRWRIHRARS